MQRIKIESSTLKEVGFEDGVMEVVFKGSPEGCFYRCGGIPAELHEGLMSAASPGGFFQKELRGARHPETGEPLYKFEKITKETADGHNDNSEA